MTRTRATSGRYTLSRHTGHGADHFDLFLERGPRLATWRLADPPETISAARPIVVEPIGDHRREYLDYEGEVGGGRGRVAIHSRGEYRLQGERLELTGGPSAGSYLLDGKSLARFRERQ